MMLLVVGMLSVPAFADDDDRNDRDDDRDNDRDERHETRDDDRDSNYEQRENHNESQND